MLSIERHEKILELLNKKRVVKVSELSQTLRVTEKTIRIDLEQLEEQNLLKRIHGGAILAEDGHTMLPIKERQSRNSHVKQAITEQALPMITEGDTILLDGGSTTLALAEKLGDKPVTVITNDIQIAHVLLEKEKVQLMVLGGTRIDTTASLIGTQAINELQKIHVNHLFLGTTGIHPTRGLTVFNSLHADWKKQIMQIANHITLLVDATKVGKIALIQYAEVSDIDHMITDDQVDRSLLGDLEQKGVNVTVV
ncbi:DeoR/GlpR family DNA-binding transcription regulator [Caldalkalibacillus salinus]|uniref:DeoR/GlpR family DNA-binding transcription regulator n=1 Tax=Caldalkalibacillus salinus TaxID=2803787 RepID=UPI001924D638|nr:DeoR/GlpR family DNA-binding transcription regulator [Caldalkalibacillus salinus]